MAYSGFAVDCQTWGMSTLVPYLGMEWLESHLGPQGGYRLFQEVKKRGGHFINGTIAGVGFTQVINQTCVNATHPGSGPVSDQTNLTCTEDKVWSAEWRWGWPHV